MSMTENPSTSDAVETPGGAANGLAARPAAFVWSYWAILVIVLALDQATKAWAMSRLSGNNDLTLIPNFLYFDLAFNTGAAFSLFERHPGVLTAIACAVSVAVLIWAWRTPAADWPTAAALFLILGGAIGNLIDRFRLEKVIDFIRVHFAVIDWSWPTFNAADSAICIGMGLLVFRAFFPAEGVSKPDSPSQPPVS